MAEKYSYLIILTLWMTCCTHFSSANKNNPPVWIDYLQQKLELTGIFENVPVGSVLGTLQAYDPENDPIIYSCESQTVTCLRNGTVKLKRVMDRELSIKNPSLSESLLTTKFIATEVNNQQDPSKSEKTITIFVRDINDNAPLFLNVPYKTSVFENSTVGATFFTGVTVEDIDSGVNAEVIMSCYDINAEDPESCQHFSVETVRDQNKPEGLYTGRIILKKTVDYEKRTSFVMTILATDKGSNTLSSSVNVLILVNDYQDNPPFFQQSPYTIFVSEEQPVNQFVAKLRAQDGDTGNPNPVKIQITNDPKSYFQVGPTLPDKGIVYAANLSLKKPLDRELLGGRYTFNISVTELSNGFLDPFAKSNSYVNVEILDENDNAPEFLQKEYTMIFPEFITLNSTGALVGSPIVAVDKDTASNAIFSIEITSQTIPGVFGVSPKTGIKSTVVSLIALQPYYLDYDTAKYRNQTVVITASQTNNTRILSSSTTINIVLTDKNDNAPIFNRPLYRALISEDEKVGKSILQLQATDKDSGRNKEIIYQLSGLGSEYFSLNASGSLILEKPLDYESLDTYTLLAFARDKGEQSLVSSVEVIIQVSNVNDNGPVFNPSSYSTNINELSTVFEPPIRVHATDKDSNTKITYAIESGNTIDNAFVIDPEFGNITLTRGIKTEEIKGNTAIIILKIKATDNGNVPQSSIAPVNINILDVNNNAPVFLKSLYEKSINEFTKKGTYVLTVNATDKDYGINKQLEYSIESGNFDAFRIEPKTGKMYVSEGVLDYDVRKKYDMVVKAEDSGTPRLSGTTNVIIKLNDINNKEPKFDRSEYFVTINENTTPGTAIITTTASDQDDNSKLEYSINKQSIIARKADGNVLLLSTFDYRNAFTINSQTGEIKTNIKFMQNLFPTISFEVFAQDVNAFGGINQIGRTRVFVIIHASKKRLPYFIPEDIGQPKKIYKFTLPEDKQRGLRITHLQAIDPTTGKTITEYRLIPNNETKGFFNITNEGFVYLMGKLDYETLNYNPLKIDILAIAANPPRTSTAEMQITVVDMNDNAPVFDRSAYVFNISEMLRYPSTVGFVKATDIDSGDYRKISYSLEGKGHEDFWMLASGEIIVNSQTNLDYEKVKIYYLQVTATDNPGGDTHKKTLVDLIINVIDINDNKPVFTSPNYTFHASELSEPGDSIGSVSAKDIDSGFNSKITYSLIPVYTDDGQPIFTIGSNNGKIIVATKLFKVVDKSPINFQIIAKDQGNPQMETLVPAKVIIDMSMALDIPKIRSPAPGQNVTVSEDTPKNQLVFTVIAKARNNSAIIYSFDEPIDSEVRKVFQINPNSGAVTLIGQLDHETTPFYYILLKVTDAKNATLFQTQRLKIVVTDVDDNQPSFKSCDTYNGEIYASVSENYPVDSFVTTVSACDKDSPPLDKMEYAWENGAGCANAEANFTAFKLIPNTGMILTQEVFDFEVTKQYVLCVKVITAGDITKWPMISSDQVQKIIVSVRDANDNGPIFPDNSMFAVINEKTIFGSEVIVATAVDKDIYPHDRVKYSILNIVSRLPPNQRYYSAPNTFKVDENTGLIKTNLQSYIKFVRGHFLITLKAEDAGHQQFFSKTNVMIYVIQPRQRSRIVFPKSPKESNKDVNELIRKLNELNQGQFRALEIYYHQDMEGIQSYDKTDVCMVVEDSGRIMTLEENENKLESTKVKILLEKYGATLAGSCNPETSVNTSKWSDLWWVLVAFAIFIFICCIFLIITIGLLYKSHKKFMESEKTSLIQN